MKVTASGSATDYRTSIDTRAVFEEDVPPGDMERAARFGKALELGAASVGAPGPGRRRLWRS